MTPEELRLKHALVFRNSEAFELSIEFAKGILLDIVYNESDADTVDLCWDKIEELNNYLSDNKRR